MRQSIRLTILLLILGSLLVYLWIIDQPSPSHPEGEFGPTVLFTLVLVCLALVVVLALRKIGQWISRLRGN